MKKTYSSSIRLTFLALAAFLYSISFSKNVMYSISFHRITQEIFNGTKSDGFLLLPEKVDPRPQETILRIIGNHSDHDLKSCVPTSQVQLDTASFKDKWILRTIGPDGKFKTIPGDEFYITYKDENNESKSPNAVARLLDLGNGSYELAFYPSRSPKLKEAPLPSGTGTITVHFVYTCGASLKESPTKNHWKENGAILVEWNSTAHHMPSFHENEQPRQFPELANYDMIYGIGNSMMRYFIQKNWIYPSQRKNMKHFAIPGTPLNTKSVDSHFLARIDPVVGDIQENKFSDNKVALLVGSCVWEVAACHTQESISVCEKDQENPSCSSYRHNWFELEDHLKALEYMITEIRRKYPNWEIYWKVSAQCLEK